MVDFTTRLLMDMVSLAPRVKLEVPNPAEKTWRLRGGSVLLDIDVEMKNPDKDRFAVYITFKIVGAAAADFNVDELARTQLAVYPADRLERQSATYSLDEYLSAEFQLARGEYRLALYVS